MFTYLYKNNLLEIVYIKRFWDFENFQKKDFIEDFKKQKTFFESSFVTKS